MKEKNYCGFCGSDYRETYEEHAEDCEPLNYYVKPGNPDVDH